MKHWLGYVSCVKTSEDWGTEGQQAIVGAKAYTQDGAQILIRRMIPGNWSLHQTVEHSEHFGIWHLTTGKRGL